jgi:RNA polymerase sigma-70 factor (ECF subfamily)
VITEAELVEGARAGDAAAFESLIRRHEHVSRRLAQRLVLHRSDAEDAVQEAFVKAYQALPGFRRGSPFRPWLLAIVANEARTHSRAQSRRRAHAERLAAVAAQDPASSAESALLAALSRAALLRALRALPGRHRDVVVCRCLLGLSEEQTAATLEIPLGTAKSRLARARARLREELVYLDAEAA